MAYLPYEEDDETLGAGGGTGGAPAGVGPTQVYNPSGPSRFTNFSAYFNANPQAGGTGLSDTIQGQAESAKTGSSAAKTSTTTRAQNATLVRPQAVQPPQAATPPATTPAKPPPYRGPQLGRGGANQGAWTQPAQPPPPVAQQPTGLSRAQIEEGASRTYAGPTENDVAATFDPIQKSASRVQRDLSMSRDAAGIKAMGGRTGFESTLAFAGNRGRLAGLRQKYGGLGAGVAADRAEATGAVKAATDASTQAQGEWGTLKKDLDAAEAANAESVAANKAAESKRLWGEAHSRSLGGRNGRPAPEGRPSGQGFLDAIDPFNQVKSPYGTPLGWLGQIGIQGRGLELMAQTFDRMSEEDALHTLSMDPQKDVRAFMNHMQAMAQKYGVR